MATSTARELLVRDIMSAPVLSLTVTQSLPVAEELMRQKHVRHIPVVDDVGKLVGLITHRDVMAAKISTLAPLSEAEKATLQEGVPVGTFMRPNVWSVTPETPAGGAARMLRDHAFGCLPVVDGGVLVGIVTEADFLSLLIDSLDADASIPAPRPRAQVSAAAPATVGEAMTPTPHAVEVTTTLAAAKQAMATHDVRHLPVREDGELVGLVSDRDIAVAERAWRDEGAEPLVGTVCSRPPYVVSRSARLDNVVLDMATRRIGSALVVEGGELVGIFTTTDACRVLGEALRALHALPGG